MKTNKKREKISVHPTRAMEGCNFLSNLASLANSRMAYKINGYLASALQQGKEEELSNSFTSKK